MAEAAAVYPPLEARPMKNTICLFDVDETLTKARRVRRAPKTLYFLPLLTSNELQSVKPEMLSLLSQLRHKCAIGYVGGSDLRKQEEQLGTTSISVKTLFDFCFPENGLVGFRLGEPLEGTNFIQWIGEEKYKKFVSWVLKYIADLDIPIKRGTFVEFR